MTMRVAYGCSKLLYFYLTNTPDHGFAFVVDKSYPEKTFHGLDVLKPEEFLARRNGHVEVFIFAVSNGALNDILSFLAKHGNKLSQNVFLYSDLFADPFEHNLKATIGWEPDRRLLQFATAYTLNSRKPIHTTICGTWLFLEALVRTNAISGDVAEVGAFECGNALCALQSPAWKDGKHYYIFDSFEGFPDLSAADPNGFGQGDYHPENSVAEILAPLSVYPQARVIKGFVPATFAELPSDGRYALVFYDCDLYQPAVDTFKYFWDKLSPGGVMLVHDYLAPSGGFTGVKQATDEFFAKRQCKQARFWQNTSAMFVKP